MKKGYTVEVFNTQSEKSTTLLVDTLIAKPTEKFNVYDVIAVSFIGTKSDIKKISLKNQGATIKLKDYKYSRKSFKINKFSDFESKEVEGMYHSRETFIRKKDLFIDQTKVNNPIVLLPHNNEDELRKAVFETVRESIVAPLFPNLTNPLQLSKELFITQEEAKVVIDNINKGNILTDMEKVAKDGIEKYHKWVDYLYKRMKENKLISPLSVLCIDTDEYTAIELSVKESVIRNLITEGIQKKHIEISNLHKHNNHYSRFDEYMGSYAKVLKKVIENQTNPLHMKGDFREHTKKSFDLLGRKPMEAQKDAIEGMIKSLEHQNRVNIVGEPGVGKTFMMSSAAYIDSLKSSKALKGLILSPDHLVKTAWEEEIKTTFNDVEYHHIKSIKDLISFERKGYFEDSQKRFFILSQGTAKSGYSLKPDVIWDKGNKVFKCPDCYQTITKRILNPDYNKNNYLPKFIDVPVSFDHYSTYKHNNRKCKKCETVLWSPNNKNAKTFKEFKSGEKAESVFLYTPMGFIPNDSKAVRKALDAAVSDHNDKKTKTTLSKIENLRKVEMIIDGTNPERRQISPYKVPISEFIFKKMKGKFTHLIIDEVHEFQSSSSARSEAVSQLIPSVKKVITGTGTMMNGYAKSIFLNLFMLFPERMKKAGFGIDDVEKFQVTFGVTEKRHRVSKDNKKTTLSPKSKPGISPIIFHKFLQDSTIFISMDDLKNNMPELKHEIVEVDLSEKLEDGKKKLENAVRKATKGSQKLFTSMIPTLYSYLDSPTVSKEVKDEMGNVVFRTEALDDEENNKLEALKRILRYETMKGRRTIVYTHYTTDGINDYLANQLRSEGFRVSVLNKTGDASISCDGTELNVAKDRREVYVKDEVSKGAEVLIVNPLLVQTGTNLIDFASICYYQMSYQIYTIRQADRRTWRIGQTEDCTIYYLYYKDSFQADIASLMATKIVASEAIEGKMDASGLEAITSDRTPEEELAKKFFEHMQF